MAFSLFVNADEGINSLQVNLHLGLHEKPQLSFFTS